MSLLSPVGGKGRVRGACRPLILVLMATMPMQCFLNHRAPCNNFGRALDTQSAHKVVDRALDPGIALFDTARARQDC